VLRGGEAQPAGTDLGVETILEGVLVARPTTAGVGLGEEVSRVGGGTAEFERDQVVELRLAR
jgi:hypothetical protein